MASKPKSPKVRHVWGINPKTRITPSKKHLHVDFDDLCPQCMGTGNVCHTALAGHNNKIKAVKKVCPLCDGTGLS